MSMWSFYGIFFALLAYRSTLVVAGTVNIHHHHQARHIPGFPDKYGNNAVIYDLDKMATNPPKILVYLPGTNSKVQGAINFLESAVSSGYLVVGLAYINKGRWGNTAVKLNGYRVLLGQSSYRHSRSSVSIFGPYG